MLSVTVSVAVTPLQPTVCHYFIRLLKEKGLLLRCYTQVGHTCEQVLWAPRARGLDRTGHLLGETGLHACELGATQAGPG